MNKLKWETPLWNMKLTKAEYIELKKVLKEAFLSEDKFRINSLAKEAALYYAEWWRREYNGGSPNKKILVNNLGLEEEYKERLYELALQGADILNIIFYKRNNTLKFRSLLIQGGLPINHIKSSGDNLGAYKRFLIGLIKYAKAVTVNWDDLSFINSLNSTSYLPDSFKNENIYNLSLLIARAIVEEDDDLLPYDLSEEEWKDFTNELKQSSKSFSYKVPFKVKWKVKRDNNIIDLHFALECANKISEIYTNEKGLNECNSFTLYCNNKSVVNYARTINNEFVVRRKESLSFKLIDEHIIDIFIKTDTNKIIDITVPNCSVPDLDNPILLTKTNKNDSFWEIKNITIENSKSVIIYSSEWDVVGTIEDFSENIRIADREFNWLEFTDSIELIHQETDESVVFDQNETVYYHEFVNWNIDWIQNANYKILTSLPEIRVYDENQEKISVKKYNVTYREFRQKEWKDYDDNLPVGLTEFKIIFPDGKYVKEKFFFTGELKPIYHDMDKYKGTVEWLWGSGNILPINNQKGLKVDDNGTNKWEITRDEVGNFYQDKIGFRFTPDNNSPDLDIYIATPFKGIVIIDQQGMEVSANKTISANTLYTYRYIVMGFNQVDTKVFHLKNTETELKDKINQGINSLSRFDDDIKNINNLYGSDTFDEDAIVRIVIGTGGNSKCIDVRDYNVYAKRNVEEKSIQIVNNREEMRPVGFKGKLYAVPVNCTSDNIEVEELINVDNQFVFKEDNEFSQFIVFTDKNDNSFSNDLVVPRFFDFSRKPNNSNNIDIEETNPQERNILEIKSILEKEGKKGEEWKKTIKYFITAVRFNLPFKTFNHFRAIMRCPELTTKMFLVLNQSSEVRENISKEEINHAMETFENEFAIAWHWINSEKHWEIAVEWYLYEFPDDIRILILPKVFEQIKELLDYTLLNNSEGLINKLIAETCDEDVRPPDIATVNSIRAKFGPSQNFPNNLVFIPDEWRQLFPRAMNNEIPIFIRAFLISPVKAALAFTGKDFSIWDLDKNNLKMRRTMNFYRRFNRADYLYLFENMVCQIKNMK